MNRSGRAQVYPNCPDCALALVNFLDDSSQKPHMKMTAIDKAIGVGESTGQGKAMLVRKMLKIGPMDPAWSLRSRIKDNPMAWMVEINGFALDARFLRLEIQEELVRKGVIPFLPEKRPAVLSIKEIS